MFFLFAWLLCFCVLNAQSKQEQDSLRNVVNTGQDTSKITALCWLSYYDPQPARRFELANEALTLARKIKFQKGEAQSYHSIGNAYNSTGENSKALDYYFKSLRIREKILDYEGIASAFAAIGLVYSDLQNYELALSYQRKSLEALKKADAPLFRWAFLYDEIGINYMKMNNLDSALYYSSLGYNYARRSDKFWLTRSFRTLGMVQTELGNQQLAFSYYRMSIANAIETHGSAGLITGYYQLAKLFSTTGNRDSAIFYAERSLSIAQAQDYKPAFINTGKLLSELYKDRDDKKALQYLELSMKAKDSIFSASSRGQIQTMTFSEQELQRELDLGILKDKEERKRNLQYAGIAIALITFVILFLVFSHSIVVKTKFIQFFGVLALLALFEFINLFIHPYLAHATNDSPVLMLLVLIAIGALLIPVHHKLEKWMTRKMVAKNKKIRLEAAKKTIATLEAKQTN